MQNRFGCRVATIAVVVLFGVGAFSIGDAFGRSVMDEATTMTSEVNILAGLLNGVNNNVGAAETALADIKNAISRDAVGKTYDERVAKAQALVRAANVLNNKSRAAMKEAYYADVTRVNLRNAILRLEPIQEAQLAALFRPVNAAFVVTKGLTNSCDKFTRRAELAGYNARHFVQAGNLTAARSRLTMVGVYLARVKSVCLGAEVSVIRVKTKLATLKTASAGLPEALTTDSTPLSFVSPDHPVVFSLSARAVSLGTAAAGAYLAVDSSGRVVKYLVAP